MYLSRLNLNLKNRRVLRELQSPYEMHRTIAKAFAPHGAGTSMPRVLFRVEPTGSLFVTVLVQSEAPPDWALLTVEGNYFYFDAGQHVLVKEYNPSFVPGSTLRFRLRANPVKREKASGKRKGLYTETDLQVWLVRKGIAGGFQPVSATFQKEPLITTGITDGQHKHAASFQSVLYEGELLVTDAALFRSSLTNGIGAGKGLGFGMLSIAPLQW